MIFSTNFTEMNLDLKFSRRAWSRANWHQVQNFYYQNMCGLFQQKFTIMEQQVEFPKLPVQRLQQKGQQFFIALYGFIISNFLYRTAFARIFSTNTPLISNTHDRIKLSKNIQRTTILALLTSQSSIRYCNSLVKFVLSVRGIIQMCYQILKS